ncbi:MAG: transcriptional repressor [Bacteroidia bacterium]|jgi:Fur family ferric uptake transcriptional regulator|nr:transcriptional repressor [Bacteroidia bacterium]
MSKQLEALKILLREHDLKVTEARLKVIAILMQKDHALTYNEIEQKTKKISDRVTLYRLLKSFEEKGLIHKTFDHEGVAKYAICQHDCDTHKHDDNHVHFNCITCNQTICMDSIEIPSIKLPRGFKANSFQFTVNGMCKTCSKN